MDGAEEQTDDVGLESLMETEVTFEILRDLADKPLERKLSNKEFRALLKLADFTKSDGTRAISVRLLQALRFGSYAVVGRLIACARNFPTDVFTSGLLGTNHFR